MRGLDEELRAAHGLPLTSYEVLLVLAWAPGRRLRMSELADLALLSLSGVTRIVGHLAREGLVAREVPEEDPRVVYAVLTEEGFARLREAHATHLAGVRRAFVDRLSDAELATLGEAWRRILAADPASPAPDLAATACETRLSSSYTSRRPARCILRRSV